MIVHHCHTILLLLALHNRPHFAAWKAIEIKLMYSISICREGKEFMLLRVSFTKYFGVLYVNGVIVASLKSISIALALLSFLFLLVFKRSQQDCIFALTLVLPERPLLFDKKLSNVHHNRHGFICSQKNLLFYCQTNLLSGLNSTHICCRVTSLFTTVLEADVAHN